MLIHVGPDIGALAIYQAAHTIPGHDVTAILDEPRGSRTHVCAWGVKLRGHGARHTRRPNPGTGGRGFDDDEYAATRDDWGYFLAGLYAIDPTIRVGDRGNPVYDGSADFHSKTGYKYM